MPVSCTACEYVEDDEITPEVEPQFQLIPNGALVPKWKCGFNPIENCHTQIGENCLDCNPGYWWLFNPTDYDTCEECDIARCDDCEVVKAGVWDISSCTKCDDETELHLTKVWLAKDAYYNRCSWNEDLVEISQCLFVDPEDISVCRECDDGYVWDPIEKICTACSDLI